MLHIDPNWKATIVCIVKKSDITLDGSKSTS
jgi:hypothetical protein